MYKLKIRSGQRFGRLTVVGEAPRNYLPCGQVNRVIRCKCKCGKEKSIRLLHLVRGRIKSCGCLTGEFHGEAGTPLYRVWTAMRDRCYRKTNGRAKCYRDKGITVCDEWRCSYLAFRKWAIENGWRKGLQIDRTNNDGNYEPGNCRFVTSLIQANNQSTTTMVEYNGERVALRLLLRRKNLNGHYAAILSRMKRGYSVKEAIEKPIRKGNYRRAS